MNIFGSVYLPLLTVVVVLVVLCGLELYCHLSIMKLKCIKDECLLSGVEICIKAGRLLSY